LQARHRLHCTARTAGTLLTAASCKPTAACSLCRRPCSSRPPQPTPTATGTQEERDKLRHRTRPVAAAAIALASQRRHLPSLPACLLPTHTHLRLRASRPAAAPLCSDRWTTTQYHTYTYTPAPPCTVLLCIGVRTRKQNMGRCGSVLATVIATVTR
jgi:hypothetical protein